MAAPSSLPRGVPIHRIEVGRVLFRAHRSPYAALYFGPEPGEPPTHRFHAPDGSFRACFLGMSVEAAFAEGIVHGPVPLGVISAVRLRSRAIAELRVVEELSVLPLFGRHMMRIGAEASVTHGSDYALSQAWARAVHEDPLDLDGILYTSRHDDATHSLALFDRAAHKVEEGESVALSDRDLRTMRLLEHYGIGLEP